MGKIHNIKSYKESLIVINHIEAILKVIDLTIKALTHYRIYLPVQKILITLKEQKLTLEIHLEHHKKQKTNKGSES